MKKKELGFDKQGIAKTMRLSDYLGDGVSQLALNSISGLIGMLTYFYTDKVGLSAAVVGTILLAVKVIDAFTDIIMGRIVDITKSRWGNIRPWFLWMAIPAFLSVIGLFTMPSNISSNGKNLYAFISNLLATTIVFTGIAIPYGCLMAVRTKSTEERSKIGITRAIFGYISGITIAIGLIPITNMLGGNQGAWIKVSVIFASISLISLLITFKSSKVSNTSVEVEGKKQNEEKSTFKESIVLLFKNKYWVIMLIVMLLINILYSISSTTGVYYTKYILGNENLVAILGGVGLIPVFIGFAITGPMIKKFGLASTARIAFIIGILANVVRIFFPYSFMATIICGAFTTFSTIPMMAVGGVLVNNTVEYGEWKFGKRLVGMNNSASSFGSKVGSGVGTAMIGWILAFGHYDGMLATQPQSAINSILVLSIYLPLALLIAMYVLLRKYDLDEKYGDIIKELEERKISNSNK